MEYIETFGKMYLKNGNISWYTHQYFKKINSIKYKHIEIVTHNFPNHEYSLSNFGNYFRGSSNLVKIKNENYVVSRGMVVDLLTLDYVALITYDSKYSDNLKRIKKRLKTENTNVEIFDNKCLNLFISNSIVDTKLFKKLLPFMESIPTTILSQIEFNKLLEIS